jgi:hypothetical protein
MTILNDSNKLRKILKIIEKPYSKRTSKLKQKSPSIEVTSFQPMTFGHRFNIDLPSSSKKYRRLMNHVVSLPRSR